MKITSTLLTMGLLFALPASIFAASYHYIDAQGKVGTVIAQSPGQAIELANSLDNVIHSGVILDQGLLENGDSFGNTYQYTNLYGGTDTVVAASFDAAHALATNALPGTTFTMIGHNYSF